MQWLIQLACSIIRKTITHTVIHIFASVISHISVISVSLLIYADQGKDDPLEQYFEFSKVFAKS
jgi:hypothetical protein